MQDKAKALVVVTGTNTELSDNDKTEDGNRFPPAENYYGNSQTLARYGVPRMGTVIHLRGKRARCDAVQPRNPVYGHMLLIVLLQKSENLWDKQSASGKRTRLGSLRMMQ